MSDIETDGNGNV